jgi:hypothetical protein
MELITTPAKMAASRSAFDKLATNKITAYKDDMFDAYKLQMGTLGYGVRKGLLGPNFVIFNPHLDVKDFQGLGFMKAEDITADTCNKAAAAAGARWEHYKLYGTFGKGAVSCPCALH